MKFVHIADVHWGMSPDSDKPWSKERSQDIKDTFRESRRTGGTAGSRLPVYFRRFIPPPAAGKGFERS